MQYSTFSMVSGETIPRRRVIRSSEIDRKASLMAKLRVVNPASPARSRPVTGRPCPSTLSALQLPSRWGPG